MHLDLQTIVLLGIWQPLLVAVVLLLSSQSQRPARAGRAMALWSLALVLTALGWAALALRPTVGTDTGMLLANALFLGACAAALYALRVLYRLPLLGKRVAMLAALAWGALLVFTLRESDAQLRLIVGTGASAGLLAGAMWPMRHAFTRRGDGASRAMLLLLLAIVANQAWQVVIGLHTNGHVLDARGGPLHQTSLLIGAMAPMLASIGFLLLYNQATQRALARLARIDRLTGVHNREALYQEADRLFASAMRHGRSLSLLRVEVDHFRRINEIVGLRGGDVLLRAVADSMRQVLRTEDLLTRLHEREFVVLLPDTLLRGARESAERLREAVAAMRHPIGNRLMAATVSVGVTDLCPGDRDLDTLLKRAEVALGAARRAGCNRVAMYSADATDDSPDGLRETG